MTKKEKALLQTAINELSACLEDTDDMSVEEIKSIECHIDALLWVQNEIAK